MATLAGLIFSRLGRILAHLGPILDRLGHHLEPILESILAIRTFFDPYNGHIWALFPVGRFDLCPIPVSYVQSCNLGLSLPLHSPNLANTANLPAMATFLGL